VEDSAEAGEAAFLCKACTFSALLMAKSIRFSRPTSSLSINMLKKDEEIFFRNCLAPACGGA
jgi:hypothetical protein